MADRKHHDGLVPKSSSSADALKHSSSVELLVRPDPTLGALVPAKTSSSDILQPQRMDEPVASQLGAPPANGGTILTSGVPPAIGNELFIWEPGSPSVNKKCSANNSAPPPSVPDTTVNMAPHKPLTGNEDNSESPVPRIPPDHRTSEETPLNPVNLISNPVNLSSTTAVNLVSNPFNPVSSPVNLDLYPVNPVSIPVNLDSYPVNPIISNPVNPISTTVPPPSVPSNPDNYPSSRHPNEVVNPPLTPKMRGKSLVTARIPPLVTKRADHPTPIGTPIIIGSGGHVFCVSTPEVDPEMAQMVPRLPGTPHMKRAVVKCGGDPFDQKRKITPPTGGEGPGVEGGGEERGEPVWQRRLSQLFVPPSDTELHPDKEPEETSQLLPKATPPLLTKDPHHTPPSRIDFTRDKPQRRESEESQWRESKDNPRKESKDNQRRESKDNQRRESQDNQRKESKDNQRRESKDSQRRESKDSLRKESQWKEERERERSQRRRGSQEERHRRGGIRKPKTARIFFQEDERRWRRGEDGDDEGEDDIPHFGKWGHDSEESRSSSSSSSLGSSEEEEAGGDDYTSWDDTICSNRSSYFKMYYNQRGIGGRGEEKENNSKLKPSLASSHNSLSSLIREKMGKVAAPCGVKKTRGDVGLMVLVGVLFVVIVVGITLTTYFYNLHLLELSIFNRLKFLEDPRHLKIYAPETWDEVLTAHLGSNLPPHSLPHDCTHYLHYLEQHNRSLPHHLHTHDDYEDMICLDWIGLAQLQLLKHPAQDDLQCYSVLWAGEVEDLILRDCLLASEEHGTWWGGGEMTSGGFPITNANVPPMLMVTGKLGRDPWGQLLRHTWISNTSSLLTLPEDFRGQVSVNHESDGQVCLEVKPSPMDTALAPNLMYYKLCTASNISSLIHHLHYEAVSKRKIVAKATRGLVQHIPEPAKISEKDKNGEKKTSVSGRGREVFKEEVLVRVKERLEHPVWIPWMTPDSPQLTQEAVLNYVDDILSQKFGFWGHILLPPSWQAKPGDLEFDPERFPDPTSMAQTIKTKGFRMALTIHPFVSVETSSFNTGTQEGLWVRQKDSPLPALAQYDEQHPSVVTDFSNPRAKRWFSSQLNHINLTYNINRFHLQPADAHALPAYHEYHMKLPGPDSVLIHFMATVSSVSPPISTEGTVTPPLPPTFLSLGTGDGSWAGLETLVPRVLTLAMLGYPLIDIGPIGGLARAGHVPERELYIRWMEAATFLPAMQISVLPNMYDEEVVQLAHDYSELRKSLVLPRYNDKVEVAITEGTPLVTPLALFTPGDSEAAQVDDEWVLGGDLLVAPVTHRGKRARNIYLPKGIWKDEIDGHLRRGGRWITNYKVPLTKIPHFTLKTVDDFAP